MFFVNCIPLLKHIKPAVVEHVILIDYSIIATPFEDKNLSLRLFMPIGQSYNLKYAIAAFHIIALNEIHLVSTYHVGNISAIMIQC